MGRSSSSLKKKRSRNRSQSRTTKKNKTKSRRNKSKKLRRRNDSVSYSDDSDSRSLVSVSSSSSEDDYASRRSRSRTRKDVKGGKKRVRRRSLTSESSLHSFRGRKQKRSTSGRKGDSYERRKRLHLRKKPRRGVSVSSASSGSRSCSTCQSGSSSSRDESEFERRRGKSERKEKQRKRFGKVKSVSKKSKDRSRGCSSCSRCSEHSEYQSEERVVEHNNSRRLRSVITVVNGEKEEIELEGDEHKEEILYDHDDYLSSKSNDSSGGGIRMEFPQNSYLASEKNKDVDDEQGEKTDVSNLRRTSCVVGNGKDGISSCDLVGKNDAKGEKKSETYGAVGNSDGDDLESVLRQRALENLRKFRGGLQANLKFPASKKDENNANVDTLSKEKAESVRLKPTSKDGDTVVTASQASEQYRLPATDKDSSGLPHAGKISGGGDCGKGSQTAEHDIASERDQVASACSLNEKVNIDVSSVYIKPQAFRQESPNTHTTLKQSSTLREHSQAMVIPRSKGNESAAEPLQSVESRSDYKNGDKIKNVHDSTSDGPSSCPGTSLADVGSDKQQVGAKDGSQFEQRTMSVMRGGELVEVSYKVYIPKKAPALARRQLKR